MVVGAPFILWGKKTCRHMQFFFSFMWGMSLYYIENWNWSMVMAEKLIISTSICPEGGSPSSFRYYVWNWGS
jgi:hypothetical protein